MEKKTKEHICSYSKSTNGYKALLQRIIRMKSKPKSPNNLVNLYLDTFLLFTTKINAATVIAAGICAEGEFTEWRKEQKRVGNLDWDIISHGGEKKSYEYKPGLKLAKNINTISAENNLNATKGYVNSKVSVLAEEFEEIKDAFDKLIAFFDRPVTAAKRIHYRANPDQLFLSKNGKSVMRKLLDEDEEVDTTDTHNHPDYSKCLNS